MASTRPGPSPVTIGSRALSLVTFCVYLGLTLSLLFTSSNLLLGRAGEARTQACDMTFGVNAYCVGDVELVRWVSIGLFTLVLAGVRLWVVLLPAAYLAWSFSSYNLMLEGGDQIASNLSILLLPFLLTVGGGRPQARPSAQVRAVAVRVSVWLIRLQAVLVYGQAAVDKIRRPEWYDGTAMYYWARDASLQQGEPGWSLMQQLTQFQFFTNALTWGVILLEATLAAAILMPRRTRGALFVVAIGFHAGIAVYYGLVTFGLAMTGLLIGALLFDVDLAKLWDQATSRIARKRSASPNKVTTDTKMNSTSNKEVAAQ